MPAAAQATVHLVAVEEGGAAAAARREAVGGHRDHGIEIVAREVAVGPRAAHQGEELVFGVLAARGFGDDLLGEHVERRIVRDDAIELAGSNGAQKRRALDEIVARGREQPSFGGAGDRVARPADALQHGGDAVRRSDLADEVDVADVDAELERCGRDQRLERPVLQTRFGVEPLLLRQAAVVRRHRVRAKAVAQMPRDAFGHPARVDEHERRAVRADQLGQPLVVLLPDLVRHDGFERRLRQLQAEVHFSTVAFVDDRDLAGRCADEKSCDLVDRLLCRRQADPLDRLIGGFLQPFERQREMGAAAPADHRVDLVDDHGAYRSQHLAAALGRQQEIQRLRRGDQNVRRRAEHRRALVLRGIAGSDRGRNRRGADAPRLGRPAESAPRLGQVLVDVRAQRFQRRDVDDANGVRQAARRARLSTDRRARSGTRRASCPSRSARR